MKGSTLISHVNIFRLWVLLVMWHDMSYATTDRSCLHLHSKFLVIIIFCSAINHLSVHVCLIFSEHIYGIAYVNVGHFEIQNGGVLTRC